jgi:hypothetical protein
MLNIFTYYRPVDKMIIPKTILLFHGKDCLKVALNDGIICTVECEESYVP